MAKKLAENIFWEFKLLDEMYKTSYFCKLNLNINEKDFDYSKLVTPIIKKPPTQPVFPISEHFELEEKSINDLLSTCNKLRSPEYFKMMFDLLKSLNCHLDSRKFFAHNGRPTVVDVVVLSSLSRCKIWTKVLKMQSDPQTPLVNLFMWYNQMHTLYQSLTDYQFDPAILTFRLKRETINKRLKNKSNPPFTEAVRRQRIEDVEKLLAEGADPDTIDTEDLNKPAICIAAEFGSLPMVKLLLKYGADIEAEDKELMTIPYYAVKSENIELLDFLFEQGVDFEHRDCQDRTPFYWACCECEIKTIEYLYKKGLKYNVYSKLNRSPLSKTAYIGRADVVAFLLSLPGIDTEHRDNRGRTALHNAVWGPTGGREGKRIGSTNPGDCPEAAQLLLEHGTDVNLKDNDGNTPMGVAAASSAMDSMRLLIAFGAKIDEVNNLKETPLTQACRYGHLNVVKLIIREFHPNRWIKNIKGHDSVQTALVAGHVKLIEFFLTEDSEVIDNFVNKAYYVDLLALVHHIENPETRIAMIELIFKHLGLHKIQIKYEHAIAKSIIELNEPKLLLQFIELVGKKNASEGMLISLLSLLVEYRWAKGLTIFMNEFAEYVEDLEFKWTELGEESFLSIDSEMFTCLTLEFQNDFLCMNVKGETLFHGLVKKRKLPLLITALDIISGKIKGELKHRNQHINLLSKEEWDLIAARKDSEGLSILEIALVRRYMDIHTILQQNFGADLQTGIKVPKYKLVMVEKVTGYPHSQRDKLNKITSLYYSKDDPEDEKEANEEIKLDMSVPKEKNTITSAQVPAEVLNFYKLEKNSQDLLALKSIWNEALAHGKRVDIHGLIAAKSVKFISTVEGLAELSQKLNNVGIVGVDVEYYDEEREPGLGMVCTIQLSTVEADYVIDCIYLRDHIQQYLGEMFGSWKIIKLFHGCDSDLRWLKNDFDIDCVRIFDTARADMLLNGRGQASSLGFLAQKHLGITLDKSYQVSDWRVRPLPQSMLDYARKDSSVLLYLWWVMTPIIDKKAAKDQTLVVHLAASLAKLCYKRFEKAVMKKAKLILEA